MQNSKIAIIGAGVSGLAAAVRLARTGHSNITVYESRREAGGRTRSYLDPTTGDMLDNGQHLMMGCYRATLEYLRMVGSEYLLERIPLAIPFHEAGKSSFLRIPPKSRPPQNLLRAIASSPLLTPREKISAIWLGRAIASKKSWEGMTCAEFFSKFRQPTGTVHKLWAPIVLATINASVEVASASLFVNVMREAFLSEAGASDLLIPRCGLSELLIEPALRMLERSGASIRLSAPVRSIEQLRERFLVTTDAAEEIFDAVICSSQSSEVLPANIRSTIPAIEYSPIINAYFWLDRKILSGPIHSFLGSTLQWAFPKNSNYSTQMLALTVSAANELVSRTNEEIRHILWTELCTAIPQAREARLLHHQIIREKRATPVFTPHAQQSRPATGTKLPRLILTGDLIQNGLPATIEGAVRNGFRAVESLLL